MIAMVMVVTFGIMVRLLVVLVRHQLRLVVVAMLVVIAFGRDHRLAVADRDPVIVRMDLAERQEAMAIAAIFDEGGLQGRFHPRDLRQVDIALDLLLGGCLEVEFFETVAVEDDDPGLFRMRRIDQHASCHQASTPEHGRSHAVRKPAGQRALVWPGRRNPRKHPAERRSCGRHGWVHRVPAIRKGVRTWPRGFIKGSTEGLRPRRKPGRSAKGRIRRSGSPGRRRRIDRIDSASPGIFAKPTIKSDGRIDNPLKRRSGTDKKIPGARLQLFPLCFRDP